MPGEPTLRERIVALETWREEHQRYHDREDERQQRHLDRRYLVIVAIIGFVGVIIGVVISKIFVGTP